MKEESIYQETLYLGKNTVIASFKDNHIYFQKISGPTSEDILFEKRDGKFISGVLSSAIKRIRNKKMEKENNDPIRELIKLARTRPLRMIRVQESESEIEYLIRFAKPPVQDNQNMPNKYFE